MEKSCKRLPYRNKPNSPNKQISLLTNTQNSINHIQQFLCLLHIATLSTKAVNFIILNLGNYGFNPKIHLHISAKQRHELLLFIIRLYCPHSFLLLQLQQFVD